MDPPPPPQPPPSLSSSVAITTTPMPTSYPDSVDSSPRSRITDSYLDDPPPPAISTTKLRLMCSYSGHIVPRPHDKLLCYVGGDTRIVVVDRHTTLSSLSSRLSNTLLNGMPFTLKYQLPNEDLDSLISVTTDEDLDNMIDEYDRTSSNNSNSNSGKSSRLRLFLFPLKPDSAQSIGTILESSGKSEDWFLNALNGAGLLNRGFSDSASVNCLLGLDDDVDGLNGSNSNSANIDSGVGIGGGSGGVGVGVADVEGLQKNLKQGGQDAHSVPDSPMMETTSSFGSTSSSPSLANLPPIRVHAVEDPKGGVVGIEEQFAHISVGVGGQKQDEGFMVMSQSPPPPLPVSLPIPGAAVVPVASAAVVGNEFLNRVYSDDERSDHGVPVAGYRKMSQPPPQTQPQTVVVPQAQPKSGSGGGSGALEVASSDSVSSDSSFSNAVNRQKPTMIYQDQVMHAPSGFTRFPANPVDPKMNNSDLNPRIQIQPQVQDSGYVLQQPPYEQHQQQQSQYEQHQQQQPQYEQYQQQQPQYEQPQQFIHAGAHYIHHHPTGAVPISAYLPVYQSQQQHQHHQLDQPYPVYYIQARQPQAYNLPAQQSSISEPTQTAPARAQTPPNPGMIPPASYNPMRNAPVNKPEMATAGMYRAATAGTPQLVQVPSSQHQQQFVGYSQVHHPIHPVAPTSAAPANYAYQFADPSHAQIYFTQPLAPTMPSHYQTMTASPTAAVGLPENPAQLPADNIKQQQVRT